MTQTINGLTSILNDAETTYERGNAEIDKALDKFATGNAGLFRADGSAVYAGPVYEEKLAALTVVGQFASRRPAIATSVQP